MVHAATGGTPRKSGAGRLKAPTVGVVLITSRSLAEYRAMFDLTAADLRRTIADCCAGGSSFVAELDASGGRAIAIDPCYRMPRTELIEAVRRGTATGGAIIDDHSDRFVWHWYGGSPARRAALRRAAAEQFAAHLLARPGAYLAAELPHLPFGDRALDLALCSHLLFTWANRFDESWHRDALTELARVAREVRVFPLVVQATGEPVPFLDNLRQTLSGDGWHTEIRPVRYEFQRGANAMLVIGPKAIIGR